MRCQNKFWLENPPDLVCSFTLLPMKEMDLAEQMNSATRLVVVIFLILLVIDIKKSLLFLISGILIIIILYYIQKGNINKMEGFMGTRENFSPTCIPGSCFQETSSYDQLNELDLMPDYCCEPAAVITYGGRPPSHNPQTAQEYRGPRDLAIQLCEDVTETGSGPNFYSRNQALAGKANPRTLIPPIITPRSHDLEYWRANNLVIHSNINAESFVDLYQSGYEVSNCCNYTCDKKLGYAPNPIPGRAPVLTEFQAPPPEYRNYNTSDCSPAYGEAIDNVFAKESNIKNGVVLEGYAPREPFQPTDMTSSYSYPYYSTNNPPSGAEELGGPPNGERLLGPLRSGMVNVACGYNPENVEVNLPTNAVTGMCPRDEAYSDYNENLFTQTIQPNLYMKSQINRPINANIGISFQQQLEPVTCQSNDEGVLYTLHDPRIIEPIDNQASDCPQMDSMGQKVNQSNIYDPRFYGYGTSYRAYTDPLTGQTRYNYDDINLIKQPNYLVRSKIDSFQFGDSYGPAKPQLPLGAVKALSQDKFMRDSLSFRSGLQESWMAKMNTILSQRRSKPNSARYFSGSGNRCK